MPYHKEDVPRHSVPALAGALAQELRAPSSTCGPNIPDIHETRQPFGGALHVKVIWDRWSEVPREERGAVILDAYEKAGLEEKMRQITLAMGLTEEEAKKLGIDH